MKLVLQLNLRLRTEVKGRRGQGHPLVRRSIRGGELIGIEYGSCEALGMKRAEGSVILQTTLRMNYSIRQNLNRETVIENPVAGDAAEVAVAMTASKVFMTTEVGGQRAAGIEKGGHGLEVGRGVVIGEVVEMEIETGEGTEEEVTEIGREIGGVVMETGRRIETRTKPGQEVKLTAEVLLRTWRSSQRSKVKMLQQTTKQNLLQILKMTYHWIPSPVMKSLMPTMRRNKV